MRAHANPLVYAQGWVCSNRFAIRHRVRRPARYTWSPRINSDASTTSFPERDLLDRAIAGDGAALQQLLIPYQSRLLARLTRKLPATLRSSIAAEDLLQETFVEIFRQIREFEPQGRAAFVRWLIMVADGRLIQAIRRHSALKRGGARPALDAMAGGSSDVPLLEILDVDTHSPSRSVAGHEIEAAVQAALLRIKPEYRDAVRMRYIEGLSVSEVAQRMGKTDWSVHKLCTRGFAAMRAALGEEVKFLSKS